MMKHSVILEYKRCRGCTTCIKNCPTEAIRVRNGKATILNERCIDCGKCIQVCPHKAIKSVSDSMEKLEKYQYRVALPDPSLYGQFQHLDDIDIVLNGLLKIGFQKVFETARAAESYRRMVARRSRREPLQHILGTQMFMGHEFRVSRHVLIPRQDTEILAEQVLKEQPFPQKRVLDLCTGSGCLAVSLAADGGYRDVTAADLSEQALDVARENARRILGSEQRIRFRQGNLFGALEPGETFDILVSNPPYIPTEVIEGLQPEVRDYEPRMAAEAADWLNPGASLYLEIGWDQGEAVRGLLEQAGFAGVQVLPDLAGKDRVVRADLRPDARTEKGQGNTGGCDV